MAQANGQDRSSAATDSTASDPRNCPGHPGAGDSCNSPGHADANGVSAGLPLAAARRKYDYPFLETFDGPQAILINGRDNLHDTVVPRVVRAGGNWMRVNNFHKVFVDDPANEREGDRDPNLITDFPQLAWVLRRNKDVRLVAIDPIESFCENDRQLPRLLKDLDALAAECNVAIVVTSGARTKKDEFERPRALTRRSHDSARCVWGLTELQGTDGDAGLRLFLPTRLNFCKAPEGIAFRITDEGAVAWEKIPAPKSEEMSQVEEAKAWLQSWLPEEEIPAKQALREGRACGFSEKVLRKALKELGGRHVKRGFGRGSVWVWTLKTEAELAAEAVEEKQKAVEAKKKEEEKEVDFEAYRYVAIEKNLEEGLDEIHERMFAREVERRRLEGAVPPVPMSVPRQVLGETRERMVAREMKKHSCDEARAREIVEGIIDDLRRACHESINRERASLGLAPYVSRRAAKNGNGHAVVIGATIAGEDGEEEGRG